MIVDWIKRNAVASLIGASLGTAAVGGSVVYVVAGQPAPGQLFAGETPFPSRFMVMSDGGHSFACDLTLTQDASCTSHGPLEMTLVRITIRRHAGDPSRVAVYGYGSENTGVTWGDLRQGVTLGPDTVAGKTLGPVTVVAFDSSS